MSDDNQKARDALAAFCNGRQRMCIPPQQDDTDLVLAAALDRAEQAAATKLRLGGRIIELEAENARLREYATKLERLVQASADDMRDAGEEEMAQAFERALQPAPEGAKYIRCNCLTKTPDPKYHAASCPIAKPPSPEAAPLGEFSDNSHEELVRVIADLRAKLARQVAANLALTTALDAARGDVREENEWSQRLISKAESERDAALKRAEELEVKGANLMAEAFAYGRQRDEAVALLRMDDSDYDWEVKRRTFLARLDAAKPKQEAP